MKMNFSSKKVAILPLQNIGEDPSLEYFCDGMTEELIHALSSVKGLQIISRASVFNFKSTKKNISEIASDLNVSIFVKGSVRLGNNQVRIGIQLIEVNNDLIFSAQKFNRQLDDIFEIQDEVSLWVAESIREHIGHFEVDEKLVNGYPISVDTYKKYLKGHHEIMKINFRSSLEGIEILKEVVEEAPNFPHALLDLNQAYSYLGTIGHLPAQEAFMESRPYLQKAIEIGSHLAETQLNLAWISCWQEWDIPKTFQLLNKALSIKEMDQIYLTYANVLVISGNFKAAHTYIDKALQLDPFSPMNHHFKGYIFYVQEKYQEAIHYFEKCISLKATIPFPYQLKGFSLLLMGREEEAKNFFKSIEGENFGDLVIEGGKSLCAVFMKKENLIKENEKVLNQFMTTSQAASALFLLILMKTRQGKLDEALALIEKGIELHFPNMLLLFTDPMMKTLFQEKKFVEWRNHFFGTFEIEKNSSATRKKMLSSDKLTLLKNEVENLVVAKEQFLDNEISLKSLAKQLDVSTNHLSEAINVGFEMSFSSFINSHRISYFKKLVHDSSNKHLTLLALAYESGFNSKTVFNTYFKKSEGMTPKQYWKSVYPK